jgi:endonuclease YncB( thermonuclease family)
MSDTIRGPVTNVIDGDTFDMKVTHTGNSNQYEYNANERIRISNIDAAELGSFGGYRDKKKLETVILGKEVRCYVQSRDTFHRIVADVKII